MLQMYGLYTKGEEMPNVRELFAAMERPTPKLQLLLPKEQNKSNLRHFRKYEPLKTKTERFRKSRITYMLYNFQDRN